jgi:hypothetical protein
MNPYHALRTLKQDHIFKQGDVLVLFGELFNRGYANGLVEEAESRGMKVIYATVGRRDEHLNLRALNQEELAVAPKPLVNIPLEAGFDYEKDEQGLSLVERLKDYKLSNWESAKLDSKMIEQVRLKGRARFHQQVVSYVEELQKILPKDCNILFAHLMAGGIPRAKIILPLMNRAVKGTGERFLSSEKFWSSDLGKLCGISFNEVTAETLHTLIQVTSTLRKDYTDRGHKVSYVAYGYHGTEILIENNYLWQTYSPYLQGWAKMQLENYSRDWSARGVSCAVYNCPEILTQSSSIFSGVEVSLYPLLAALQKEGGAKEATHRLLHECQSLLKEGIPVETLIQHCWQKLQSPAIKAHCDFEKWPQHNSQSQLETLLQASDELTAMHKDPKKLISFPLSEVVFKACGAVMLADAGNPETPVSWINHDLIAKVFSVQNS